MCEQYNFSVQEPFAKSCIHRSNGRLEMVHRKDPLGREGGEFLGEKQMRLPYFRFKWIEHSFGASIEKREERPVVVAGFALCTDALSIQFYNSVNCDRPGECSPEKDCLR